MTQSRLYCPEEEFTGRLRARMPMDVGFSFTQDQLQALRTAFGTRFERRHSLDMRGRFHLPWSRYYLVLQFGRDQRNDHRQSLVSKTSRTVIDTMLLAVAAGGMLAGLAWLAARFL